MPDTPNRSSASPTPRTDGATDTAGQGLEVTADPPAGARASTSTVGNTWVEPAIDEVRKQIE